MRKAFLIFLFAPFLIGAQQYGNEWINFSQQYFKIPIYKTGIHRLEYSTIKISFFQAGIDISDIGTNEFQVFGREKEVALFIEDCLLYTSPSPRDDATSRMPSSA